MSLYDNQGMGAASAYALPTKPQDNPPHLPSLSSNPVPTVGHTNFHPHNDARAIVRLVQCSQCSCPLKSPHTLPCGNSICKSCIPVLHPRDHISYPATESRHGGFQCPFAACGKEHVIGDCSQDVTLSKLMDRIGDQVAKQRPLSLGTPTLLDERLHWRNLVDSSKDERIPSARVLHGGRLLATYTLAQLGLLRFDSEVAYQTMSPTADTYEVQDHAMLRQLEEATKSELDCQVCYALIHDPVTTPCGHTFCRHCVARIIDHSPLCPICRRALRLPPAARSVPSNKRLHDLLSALCPDLLAARAEQIAQETAMQGNENVPLFICTNAFPSMPTFLHVFEPRYRLMIRRAVESGDNRFGMIMYNRRMNVHRDLGPAHFMPYGTMLHINNVQLTLDGRSMLDTRGVSRFRVKSWTMVDGYVVGRIEHVNDIPLAEEEAMEARETTMPPVSSQDIAGQIDRMPTLDLLHMCTDFIQRMRAASASWLHGAHFESHGEMPTDAALFPYWFASILPMSEEEKYRLLPTTSVRERLKITAKWVKRIEADTRHERGTQAPANVGVFTDDEAENILEDESDFIEAMFSRSDSEDYNDDEGAST